jgi:DNA-binding NarL/FixJ family response regulator
MRTDILERKEEIEQWIAEGKTKAQMARELGCNPKTINPILKSLVLNMPEIEVAKDYQNLMDMNYLC